ncbi:regulator of G-protein signaling 9-binding protein [Megalops cyprinoides]|uniref:regulator of G-protein signaling 9-binding protein n=1 Tax=Megalops cyprinoides TaxID=118141 RepID=UPI0018643951|nr:regulator of G-protein signaling 9-binding protein [Megalops cyprinoides]
MNRWRKSVGEIQARRRPVAECERAQAALSKVTACYQQLATFIGSSSDCSRLREELEETRVLAHSLCKGLQKRLITLLLEGDLSQDEREEAERLWVLFMSVLEIFQEDLRKVVALQGFFPLSQRRDRRALVNAGCTGGGSGVAARAASVQPPWIRAEEEQSPDLRAHIAQLECMVHEMLQKVNVPFWSVEATQEAWVEGCEEEEKDDEEMAEEMLEVEVVPPGQERVHGCCHKGCRPGWVLCLLN